MGKVIKREALQEKLAGEDKPTLVDVSLPDVFGEAHLPGAVNACVYQVDFLERMAELVPDKSAFVVVYGSSSKSLDSSVAVEKLEAAGYSKVAAFRGGLKVWKEAKQPLEGSGQAPAAPPVLDGERSVDTEESMIEWVGRNLANKHRGALRISSGAMKFVDGAIKEGCFVIDMNSIENHNLQDEGMRQGLVGHLKSDDFFDTAKFPEAEFELLAMEPIDDVAAGSPNYTVVGKLTVKGVTNEIKFKATAGADGEGRFVCQANFDIDRTLWNVIYGSGKFFERLGMHLVNDLVSLQLKIVA